MRETGRGEAEHRKLSIFNSSKHRNKLQMCPLMLTEVLNLMKSVYTAINHEFSSNRPLIDHDTQHRRNCQHGD